MKMAKKGKVSYLPKQAIEEMERIKLTDDINVNSEALRKMASYSKIGWEVKKNITTNKEINRVLRPGGCALVSTPNLAAWHIIASLFLGWQPFVANLSDEINIGNPLWPSYKKKAAGGKYPVHRRIPTYRGIRELFEYHGFAVENLIGVGYYPFPTIVARLLSRIDPRHAVYLTMKIRKR